ncbi:hypothetical protein Glove_346g118 [Diversispora epigaea]|uniref:Uncharacterized protein n=1 Tax=Diversispora epigaea TaxID=1348612 RepID=A0A397HEW5_9GLOM|nr:hypothetical protein Glove_346g118 [Diversispora epigaea]
MKQLRKKHDGIHDGTIHRSETEFRIIMWQLTSGHRLFHDQEHGPKLILDILRPEITVDTPQI